MTFYMLVMLVVLESIKVGGCWLLMLRSVLANIYYSEGSGPHPFEFCHMIGSNHFCSGKIEIVSPYLLCVLPLSTLAVALLPLNYRLF